MSLSEDNSKKIGLAIILVGLMVVIIGFGKIFEDKLKIAALTQSSMANLTEYQVMDGYITYKLPDDWLTTSVEEQDERHVYINEYISIDADIYGEIELINNDMNFNDALGVFMDNAKSMGGDGLKSGEITVDNVKGELIEYNFKYSDKNTKSTYEYYIPKDSYIFKMTFTLDSSKIKENTKTVLNNIVNTVKFNDNLND